MILNNDNMACEASVSCHFDADPNSRRVHVPGREIQSACLSLMLAPSGRAGVGKSAPQPALESPAGLAVVVCGTNDVRGFDAATREVLLAYDREAFPPAPRVPVEVKHVNMWFSKATEGKSEPGEVLSMSVEGLGALFLASVAEQEEFVAAMVKGDFAAADAVVRGLGEGPEGEGVATVGCAAGVCAALAAQPLVHIRPGSLIVKWGNDTPLALAAARELRQHRGWGTLFLVGCRYEMWRQLELPSGLQKFDRVTATKAVGVSCGPRTPLLATSDPGPETVPCPCVFDPVFVSVFRLGNLRRRSGKRLARTLWEVIGTLRCEVWGELKNFMVKFAGDAEAVSLRQVLDRYEGGTDGCEEWAAHAGRVLKAKAVPTCPGLSVTQVAGDVVVSGPPHGKRQVPYLLLFCWSHRLHSNAQQLLHNDLPRMLNSPDRRLLAVSCVIPPPLLRWWRRW